MKRFLAGLVFVLMIGSVSGLAEGAITDGLVAWWQLDGNANDSSGGGHDGTVVSATATQDRLGNPSSALLFAGASYVTVPNAADLNPTDAITFTAWFKATSFDLGRYSWPCVLRKSSASGGYGMESSFVLEGKPGMQTWVNLTDGFQPSAFIQQPPWLSAGEWYFVAGVYDGSNMYGYLGDASLATLRVTSVTHGGTIGVSNTDLYIGAPDANYDYQRYFKGAIDDVRIWNRALSAAEVDQVYSAIPEPTTLIVWSLLGVLGISVAQWRRRKRAA